MYYLTQKTGTKKIALAEWIGDDKACPRLAEVVFLHHGLNSSGNGLSVEYKTNVEKQKIYKGKSPDFQLFTDTIGQADDYFNQNLINSYLKMGKTKEYILDLYPEWGKYF